MVESIVDFEFPKVLFQEREGIAIEIDNRQYSYPELHQAVSKASNYFHKSGYNKGDVIGISIEPSFDLIVWILATLKSGLTFLLMDTQLPLDRKSFMLKNSSAKSVISESDISREIKSIDPSAWGSSRQFALAVDVDSTDLAYIMYTSGTTGRPKGVMVSFGALRNYLKFSQSYLNPDTRYHIPLITSISSDLTLTSIFLPLISGNTLVIYNGNNMSNLLNALANPFINFIKCTPTHLGLFNEENTRKSNLEKLVVGGELFLQKEGRRVYEYYNGNLEIFNEYGPTESTIGCTYYKFRHNDAGPDVPIGLSVPGTKAFVVDEANKEVKKGEKGRLLIGGKSLANGYIANESLTHEKLFDFHGELVYDTGDIVKNEKGNFRFLGRNDNQIKLNGYRVELEEISTVLNGINGIERVHIQVDEDKTGKFLSAYIKAKDISPTTIHDEIKSKLPPWMIPRRFFVVEQFVTNLAGKLDAQNSQATPLEITSDTVSVGHHSEEISLESLTNLVQQKTEFQDIISNENLLQKGLDSINLIYLIADLEDHFHRAIHIEKFIEEPTVENLYSQLSDQNEDTYLKHYNESSEDPIICLPPAFGGILSYRHLASTCPDIHFIAFDFRSSFKNPITEYLEWTENLHVNSPIIIGYSGGGNLGFELIKKLEERDETPKALILIDSYRKNHLPEKIPSSIEQMKRELIATIPRRNQVLLDQIDTYYDLINLGLDDYRGFVTCDIHLISSESRGSFGSRKVNGKSFFHSWESATKGKYIEHSGFGKHEEMLQPKFISRNAEIIRNIISSYR